MTPPEPAPPDDPTAPDRPIAPDRLVAPDRLIAIDWSGDKGPGQRKKIWAGVWTRNPKPRTRNTLCGAVTLEGGRTRAELTDWLLACARETPRMAISLDCCFSFPAWFLAEHACTSVFDFWQHVASGHGERWLGVDCPPEARDPRFWGKPHKRPACFSGENIPLGMRLTDMDNKIEQALAGGDPARAAKMRGITPKSPFQVGGSGSVGTGSLRAMPHLLHLHQHGFRVWPFEDAALTGPHPQPLLLEMYTRLMTGPVKKSNPAARAAYLATRTLSDPILYAALPREVLAKARSSEDAFDALISCLEMLRHRQDFPTLRATDDPTLRLEGITWRPGLTAAL